MPLSDDVLRHVVARADQKTRVACCLSSKQLRDVVQHPSAWRRVRVYDLCPQASTCLRRIAPEVVHLTATSAHRLEWFLDGMIRDGLHHVVRGLEVHLTTPRIPQPSSLLETLGEFAALEDLAITVGGLTEATCLAFPKQGAGPRTLRTLYIAEDIAEEDEESAGRQLEVYFRGARLPALEHVHVFARTSDVLAHCRRCPSLRKVEYYNTEESYEDADLADGCVTDVTVDVRNVVALGYLAAALRDAWFSGRLTLRCHADLEVDERIHARHVSVQLAPTASRIAFEYAAVRGAKVVSVAPMAAGHAFEVTFRGCGSWDTFQLWAALNTLRIGVGGTVVVVPT